MNRPPPKRIPSHVAQWMLLCLALAGLGGILAYTLWGDRAKTEATEREHLLGHTHVMAQIIAQDLSALDTVLGTLAEDLASAKGRGEVNDRLATLAEAMPGVRTFVLLDAQGIARASNRLELLGRNFSQREYFTSARQDPDPSMLYVTSPFRTVLGIYAINVSRVITGPGGAFSGVVSATLDPQYFQPLLESMREYPDIRASVVHEKGDLFAIAPDMENFVGRNLAQSGGFFLRHLKSGKSASIFEGRTSVSGEDRMVVLRTVQPAGLRMNHTLVVTITRSLEAVYAPTRTAALVHGGLYAATVLLSVTVFAFYQRNRRARERERAEAASALEARERLVRGVIDSVPGLVAYWDSSLRCVYANNAYQDWFGKTQEQMRGIHIKELLGPELYAKNEPYILGALRGEVQRFERTLVKADGTTRYTMANYIPDAHGGLVNGFIVLVADVTELKSIQMELEHKVLELDHLATTDPLTGIGNRRSFYAHAGVELARGGRYGQPLVFLMLDIDHFKGINDTRGHDAGDEVLRSLADTLRETLRATDVLGRVGGEEFAAVLVQTCLEEARPIAERLRRSIEANPAETGRGPVPFTVSIGLAAFPGSGANVETLMKHADEALYAAKQGGRNLVRCFEDL